MAAHAKNYFARNLVPQTTAQIERATEAGCAENTVCLACWHNRREAFLENEFHVLCVCPEYSAARQDFMSAGITLNQHSDMIKIFRCSHKADAEHLAKFLVRTRQIRRKLKVMLENHNEAVLKKSFAAKRAAWRFKGRACCRHGVLFTRLPDDGCKCMTMSASSDSDWEQARFMPVPSHDLKIIVAAPFQRDSFRRLNIVQHLTRSWGW